MITRTKILYTTPRGWEKVNRMLCCDILCSNITYFGFFLFGNLICSFKVR